MLVDGNGNMISVEKTEICNEEGHPLVVVRLVNDPAYGYVCTQEDDG